MQYLLTEAEYNDLKLRADRQQKIAVEGLQAFCTKVANEMPIKFWGNKEAQPWRCILNDDQGMGYCDECPAQKVCPHPHKRWSK